MCGASCRQIKSDSNIKRVKIQDNEFILGQYADDTFFLLDGTESSLYHCLNGLDLFANVNIDKMKAVLLGCKRYSATILLPSRNLTWIYGETFEVL